MKFKIDKEKALKKWKPILDSLPDEDKRSWMIEDYFGLPTWLEQENKNKQMTLKEKIQYDKSVAMKTDKELSTLLGTVIGECDRITKNPTDEEVIKIIKKMIESSLLCGIKNESLILEKYLPKQLSEQELENEIIKFCKENNYTEKKNLGLIMKHLKDTYSGLYDGKLASQIATKILK